MGKLADNLDMRTLWAELKQAWKDIPRWRAEAVESLSRWSPNVETLDCGCTSTKTAGGLCPLCGDSLSAS